MLTATCWKSCDVALSGVALFSFPDALKAVGEVNPKILLQKADGCKHKFRNVEGCGELVACAMKLLGISSVDAAIVQ
jgi:hypothetical protein